jgi:hypothetical protein
LPFCEGFGGFLGVGVSLGFLMLKCRRGDCWSTTYVVMHSLVLRLKRKDVFRALRPCFAVVRIDVRHHVSDAVFVVADGIGVAVEVAGAVPLSVEVSLVLQGVVAVEGDDEFYPVAACIVHEVVEAVEDFVVPGFGSVAFEAGVTVYLGAFLGGGLAWDVLELLCASCIGDVMVANSEVGKDSPSSQTRSTCTPASFRPVNRVVC